MLMISLIIGMLLIKMTILYSKKEYNLTSGVPKILLNIRENTDLSFYLKATAYQMAITTITLNSNISPFGLIVTCSYKSLNSNCFNKLNRAVFFKKKGNQLVTTDEYSTSNNYANYIGIHILTNKNISYLNITTSVGGKFYDFSAGLSKNIKNLLPSFPYTFKVPVKEFQKKLNVTFTILNDTTKPFDYAYVHEYRSESGTRTNGGRHKIANVSPKNNRLKLSFYYIFFDNDINYIDVVITPNKKIANLKVKIDLDYCFDLTTGYNSNEIYPKNLTNLKSKINYYLHFRLKYLQYANITLSMNKMPFQPFNIVSISFYEDQTNSYPKNYSNQVVSFEEINNKLLTNLTIHNNNKNTKLITLILLLYMILIIFIPF